MILSEWYWLLGSEAVLALLLLILGGPSARPWAAALLGLLAAIAYDLSTPSLAGLWLVLAYFAIGLVPLALAIGALRYLDRVPLARGGFRLPPGQFVRLLLLSAAMVGVYLLLTLEPGLLSGFVPLPPVDPISFAMLFLGAPVIALGQEALYRGYALGGFADRLAFPQALAASSLLYAATFVDPRELLGVGANTATETFFLTVAPQFVLGACLGMFFYKSGWSLLGPWIVHTGVLWVDGLLPVAPSNVGWEILFVFSLLAIGAMLLVLEVGIAEPRYRQRRYLDVPVQPRRRTLIARARRRRETRNALAALGVCVVVAVAATPVFDGPRPPPFHLYAIASGSMVPTFTRGELVLVEAVPAPGDLRVGEIIAYNGPYLSPSGPVVHRILRITHNSSGYVFTTKGDHNPSPDPRPVLFSQVDGVVIGAVPILGYLILSPPLLLGLLALGFLAAIFFSVPPGPVGPNRRPVLPRTDEELR